MAPAEAFEPFQHPLLALERSGAGEAIGARVKEVGEEVEDGEEAAEQQRNAAAVVAERASARPVRGPCAREESQVRARALRQGGNGERRKKCAEEGPEALPLWLIWAAGEGSGIEMRLRGVVWPGVA